jgi:hypothetical protein
MDELIPSHPSANYDYLDIIFIQFRSFLGESVRQSLPKDANLLRSDIGTLLNEFTKILDQQLWEMLFNRLNILSLMSTS